MAIEKEMEDVFFKLAFKVPNDNDEANSNVSLAHVAIAA